MIRINVEEYCHDCPEFEPYVVKPYMSYDGKKFGDTFVTCEHKKKHVNVL